MKTSVKIVTCMVFGVALLTVSCVSRQSSENERVLFKNELEGVWKLIEVDLPGPDGFTSTKVQPSVLIITRQYMTFMGVMGEDPRPELPENPTDAQIVAAWNPLRAVTGSYEVKGNTITSNPIVGKRPNWGPDDTMIYEYEFEGDDLSVRLISSLDGPIENPLSFKYTRVE